MQSLRRSWQLSPKQHLRLGVAHGLCFFPNEPQTTLESSTPASIHSQHSPTPPVPLPTFPNAQGETGIRINPAGHPVGDALSLEGYGALRALSGVGRHLLVWTPERLCVLEADTGACVQTLGLAAADPGGAAAGQAVSACNDAGAVLVAPRAAPGSTAARSAGATVFLARPVPAWDQVRDALAHGEAEAALRLSSRGEARGEAWAQAGLALVGLALLRGKR